MSTAVKAAPDSPERARARQIADRLMAFVRHLSQHYFRTVTVVEDANSLSPHNQVIFATNHSGMNFPWDCFVLYEELLRRCGGGREIRPLSAPVLLNNPLLSPFALPESWNYFSAPATMQSFEELMKSGASILINPEGVAGIGKGFNHRYQLQPFSSSFVRMALKYKRAIVPVSVVNGEYLNPFAYSSKTMNRLAGRLGIPFLPVGPTILLLAIFPCVAYISLPARLHYVIGRRIDLSQWTDKSYDELSTPEIRALTARVQEHMQRHLDGNVARYGSSPFDLGGLFRSMRARGWKSLALFPLFWPVQVHRAFLGDQFTLRKLALSSIICLALCLPVLGWPLLFLILGAVSVVRGWRQGGSKWRDYFQR